MKNKKKIGIIGGVGPQATTVLYDSIIKISQKKYYAQNNDEYPHICIESIPIPDFISNTNKIKLAKKMLIETVNSLDKNGATILAIASNTVHVLLDELKHETSVPFISMIDCVVEKCKNLKCEKAGILASTVTVNSKIYTQKLEQQHIACLTPDIPQQKVIDKIIKYVLAGQDNGSERQAYIDILNDMYSKGADTVILGCTELPLAINYEALGNKVINSMENLAENLVDYYYSDK